MDLLSDDPQLLRAFKRGDSAALTSVYKAYLSDIFTFLKKGFVFNTQGNRYFFKGYQEPWHLENALQEVFIKAFSESARDAYDGIRPYRNYLFRIARNTVMDDFRYRSKDVLRVEHLKSLDEDGFPDPSDAANPETQLLAKQLAEQVQQYSDQLSQDIAPFFDLRFQQAQSIEQIATALGWSEHKVKKQEKLIKKDFFNWLKRRGYLKGYRYSGHRLARLAGTILMICSKGGG